MPRHLSHPARPWLALRPKHPYGVVGWFDDIDCAAGIDRERSRIELCLKSGSTIARIPTGASAGNDLDSEVGCDPVYAAALAYVQITGGIDMKTGNKKKKS